MRIRMGGIPFDSDRKLMSTINRIDGKNIVIVKGAFDVMASRWVSPATAFHAARNINDTMSRDALRVLAVGWKEINAIWKSSAPTSLRI